MNSGHDHPWFLQPVSNAGLFHGGINGAFARIARFLERCKLTKLFRNGNLGMNDGKALIDAKRK